MSQLYTMAESNGWIFEANKRRRTILSCGGQGFLKYKVPAKPSFGADGSNPFSQPMKIRQHIITIILLIRLNNSNNRGRNNQ